MGDPRLKDARRAAPPPPPPARRSLGRKLAIIVTLALGIAFAGVVFGLVMIKRVETGEWGLPDTGDFERIVKVEPGAPARVIYLARRPIELRAGRDDSSKGISSAVASVRAKAARGATATQAPVAADQPVKLPGWNGTDKGWKQVLACVRKLFEPFDVVVSDEPPTADDFVLVAVGGKPKDLGVKDRRVGGLAPFNGGVIAKPVVFAFSAQLGNDVRNVCETIGMEVAHAYGLDHGYSCNDVMTYLPRCGARTFTDKDVRCGEGKARNCEGGEPTQNSYRRLLQVLGPRSRTKAPSPTPSP
ncbi:MAG: hypothetical protein H0T46_27175 [Deltaproteobacteria bacterium]|nr:hypothetical protein [Deltaproteobacteria bacterium]